MEELKAIQNNFYTKFSIDTIINILSYISSKHNVLKENKLRIVFINNYSDINFYIPNTLYINKFNQNIIYISSYLIAYNMNELNETFKIMTNSVVILIILNNFDIYDYGLYKFLIISNDDYIDNLKTIMKFNKFLISSGIWNDINNNIKFGTMLPSIDDIELINKIDNLLESLN